MKLAKQSRPKCAPIKLKTNDPEEKKLLEGLRQHLDSAENSLWECGRIINELKESYGYITSELAVMFRQRRNRLDELAKTARTFPEGMRDPSLSFSGHEVARKAARRAQTAVLQHCGEKIEPPLKKALELAAKQKAANGKHDGRDLTKAILANERQKREPQRRATIERLSKTNAKLIGSMNHASCLQVLPTISPASCRLIHLDPPYANYEKSHDGSLYKGSASVATDCDNNDRERALTNTIEALRLSITLLVPNGVILLWQAARRLPTRLSVAIDDLGLIDHPFIVWDKGHAQLGNASMGVMYSTETCYVLTRDGEWPIGESSESREQVIRHSRERQSAANFEVVHLMQKPRTVNEELLRRFTASGDTVLDAFGCSASMCVAAQEMGRNWIYCESNPQNFALGKRNMEELLAAGGDRKTA